MGTNDISIDTLQQENAKLQEYKDKLQKSKKETQDLKYDLQKKSMEVEMKDKKINELNSLIKELKQYNPQPSEKSSMSQSAENKQLKEEIARLNSINKNRNDLLQDIDSKT